MELKPSHSSILDAPKFLLKDRSTSPAKLYVLTNFVVDTDKVKISLFDNKNFQLSYLTQGWTFIPFYTSAYSII